MCPDDRQPVPAEENRALEPIPERIEDAVADRRELRRDVVRDVERLFHLLHALSVGAVPGCQASFSLTTWLTTEPSARPETWGITSAITLPKSRMLVAPFSAIASSTISSSSASVSGSGMNS